MKKWLMIALASMSGLTVLAQTNPAVQSIPYSQDFGTTTFTTAPTGWAAWNGINGGSITTQALAESSSPSGNATITAATAAQTGGGVYGFASSSNGRFYVQTSSNATNGVNQFVLAVNTTGKSNLTLSYDVEMISAQPRTIGIVAQYRVGTSGSWTTIAGTNNPFSQAAGTAGVKASPSLSLPVGAENQPEVQIRWSVWRGSETGNSSGIAIDNVSISQTNNAPTASSVSFSGTLTQGQILTGSYTYADTETDPEGTSTFKWYKSDDVDGLNKTAIDGATNLTFSPTAFEVGKFISFEVTPVASSGSTTGSPVESPRQGTIAASSNNAPVASSVAISGTVKEGETLTGNYTYSDTENDVQGTSTFKWYRSNDGEGSGKTAISGAVNTTYNLTIQDAGKYISFQVTPVASTGTVLGNAVESSIVGPVEALPNDAPVASNVSVSGSYVEGQTLTASYTYSDTEGNTEGSSLKKWYRSDDASGTNQSEISGATALTYQLTGSDLSKYISFQVTPVATVGSLTGNAVSSTRQGPVIGTPTITTVGTLASFGTIGNNSVSAEKTYRVTAKSLTTDLVITAPSEFKLSLVSGSGYTTTLNLTPTSGNVDTTTIYVVFSPTTVGAKSGNIMHNSTGSAEKTVAVAGTSAVELPIYEPFNYTEASNLGGQGGWANINSGDEIVIAAGNLDYSGMGSSTGNKATFGGAGIDPQLTFVSVAEGRVYFSFLLNVSSIGSLNAIGGYFSGIAGSSSTFGATIWMRLSGSGFNIGINPRTTAANTSWSATVFPLNTTILVVGSYDFVDGTGNDIVRIWLDPTVPGNEPVADISVVNTGGTDLTSIDRFFIRQDGTSATAGVLELDELRVAASWESAGLPVELTSFTASAFGNGVSLNWSTATESNNAGWEIERSTIRQAQSDNYPSTDSHPELVEGFQKVGFVAGKGTTTETQYYSFTDSKVFGKAYYRLKQIDNDGAVVYSDIVSFEGEPSSFTVKGNYPNPFNPTTAISYQLSSVSLVKITVFDVLGRSVVSLVNQEKSAGNHTVNFDGKNLTSGLYFYTVTANGKSITKSMMLMK